MSSFSEVQVTISFGEKEIQALLTQPNNPIGTGIILTHGAGGDMYFPQLTLTANTMAQQGYTVLRFTCKGLNLAYRTKVYKHVLEYFHGRTDLHISRCFLAGRSMGSRAALGAINTLESSNLQCFVKGIICLAYPLHKPGELSDLRDKPLGDLQYPCLFISGTNDEMCHSKLLQSTVKEQISHARSVIFWIEGANHGFKVKGKRDEEVVESYCDEIEQWISELSDQNDNVKPCQRNNPEAEHVTKSIRSNNGNSRSKKREASNNLSGSKSQKKKK